MAKIDKKYNDILNKILNEGYTYKDPNRKGVFRTEITNYRFEYDLKDGFPAITTKKLAWKSVVGELLLFLRGDTNIKYLVDNNIPIWNKDAYNWYLKCCKVDNWDPLPFEEWLEEIKKEPKMFESLIKNRHCHGDLGRSYGYQLRNFNGEIDQLKDLIRELKSNPMSTRHRVTYINPSDKDYQALPPCHSTWQVMCYPLSLEERCRYLPGCAPLVDSHEICDQAYIPKYGFDLVWMQESVDTYLGLPFNITSYALLAHIIGAITNMVPGILLGDLRNVHLYDNSIEGAKEQLKRDVNLYGDCSLSISGLNPDSWKQYGTKIFDMMNIDDFKLVDYNSYPSIKVEMLERNK